MDVASLRLATGRDWPAPLAGVLIMQLDDHQNGRAPWLPGATDPGARGSASLLFQQMNATYRRMPLFAG